MPALAQFKDDWARIGGGASPRAPAPRAEAGGLRWTLPGFGPLTRIETDIGPFPAQTLRVRDRLRVRGGGFAEIRWLDRFVLSEDFLERHPDAQPVEILADAFGRGIPRESVLLSPAQSFSVEGSAVPEGRQKAGDLLGGRLARRRPERLFTYTLFHCGEPVEVRVEGLWVPVEPARPGERG